MAKIALPRKGDFVAKATEKKQVKLLRELDHADDFEMKKRK